MSVYTKGPWEVCEDGMIRQQGDRGLWVSSLVDIPARDGGIVATDANARLMAAAPELLEALKKLLTHFFAEPHVFHSPECRSSRYDPNPCVAEKCVLWAALAAIAKAEGRE